MNWRRLEFVPYDPCKCIVVTASFVKRIAVAEDGIPSLETSRRRGSPHHRTVRQSVDEYGRGVAGGVLFSLPQLYTMEMWWAGFSASPEMLLVCGGIARWLGWNSDAVRILYVLGSIFSAAFPGTIVYIIL